MAVSGFLYTAIFAVLVLAAIAVAGVGLIQDVFLFAVHKEGMQSFQAVLEQAFNLVIGIEFIKMLAKHTPGLK